MLDYLGQVSEELQENKSKDEIIKDLREKLVQQEMNEALINELRSQIDFQKRIDSLTKSNKKCKTELARKSAELDRLNVEMKKLNSSLVEKYEEIIELKKFKLKILKKYEDCQVEKINQNKIFLTKGKSISRYNAKIRNVTKYKKTVELQFKESQAKLLNIEKDNQLCEAENDKLNRELHNNIPLDCSPFESNPGIHAINIPCFGLSDVLCSNISRVEGSWLVIRHQVFGGEENFNRDWATYREGFGSLDSEFFLGLPKIHRMTSSRRHELYVYLIAKDGSIYTARYDDFQISDENSGYALKLGKLFKAYSKGDIKLYEDMKFSTYDRDNDKHKDNCASLNKFGWWYKDCATCERTGLPSNLICGVHVKELTMMIRPI
ncbi:angiopoietin-related protein 7-like [Drosophila nasuta]|uniref:angiopoietin-related protein 7-like n=1 Tax=Drosophila nasuta TaxID=42062 RepID=UPI00295EED08|nr:angiopoietin-related protein 7-like [Drosophila nasuta]